MASPISVHATDDFWARSENIDLYLARKLCSGSASLVLGAGASLGFGLPSWQSLVDELWRHVNADAPSPRRKPEEESDVILANYFDGDRVAFAAAVHNALYKPANRKNDFLLQSVLLQAVTAFLSSSLRGKGGAVITFNFDNLLETYLRLLGYVVASETVVPAWTRSVDVMVFHPHGLLPFEGGECTEIVFTATDYDNVVGKESDPWNKTMLGILGSSFPVFLGLSGEDARMRSLFSEVMQIHPATCREYSRYWGVRPSVVGEEKYVVDRWKKLGVVPRFLNSYAEIPSWLLSICQLAASLK